MATSAKVQKNMFGTALDICNNPITSALPLGDDDSSFDGLTAEQLVASGKRQRNHGDLERYYGRNMKEHIEWTHYLNKYFANKARTFPTER